MSEAIDDNRSEIGSKNNRFLIENGRVYINGTEIHKVTKIETRVGGQRTEVTLSFDVPAYPPCCTNMKLG